MWEFFLAGGPIMWPLLLCSITALAVILERLWFWKNYKLAHDSESISRLLQELQSGAYRAAKGDNPLLGMLKEGMTASADCRDKAMEAYALQELERMNRGMNILDTIITAAPMLGILGTVLGIISSFDMLGAAGVNDPKQVIAGIAEALITTASGLGIATATVFPFNYFNSRIEKAQNAFEIAAAKLQVTLEENNRNRA